MVEDSTAHPGVTKPVDAGGLGLIINGIWVL